MTKQIDIISALKQASPYIQMYKDKTFVIKAGGGTFDNQTTARQLLEQISILQSVGIRVVLVHGGGNQISSVQKSMGIEPQMIGGRRVTDAQSIQVTGMVLNGLVNTQIISLCRELGLQAVGVSGVSANLISANKRAPVDVDGKKVDFGFVGDIAKVDGKVLSDLLDDGFMPVVSPLSADDKGTLLNINADTVAANIAAALKAEKLILCTGAAGIMRSLDDEQSLISYVDLAGLDKLKKEGIVKDGMLPKIGAVETALKGGVKRTHIISYQSAEALLAEIFTNEGKGTLIVSDISNTKISA